MTAAEPPPSAVPLKGRGALVETPTPLWSLAPAAAVVVLAAYLGAAFVVLGLPLVLVVIGGCDLLAGAARRALRRRNLRLRGHEPWEWDARWRRDGESRGRRVSGAALFVVGAAAAALGAWGVTGSLRRGFTGLVVLGLVHFVLGISLLWIGWRRLSRGALRVFWQRFPFFVGERVELFVGMSAGGATFRDASFVLRRLEEFPSRLPRTWITWERRFEAPHELLPGPEHDLAVAFDVPADVGGTWIDERAACRWELVVRAKTDRGPIEERFYVPIYERPSA